MSTCAAGAFSYVDRYCGSVVTHTDHQTELRQPFHPLTPCRRPARALQVLLPPPTRRMLLPSPTGHMMWLLPPTGHMTLLLTPTGQRRWQVRPGLPPWLSGPGCTA